MSPKTRFILPLAATRRRMICSLFALFGALFLCVHGACAGDQPVGHNVYLIIDYGNGVQKRFTNIPWTQGMTAFDAMNAAQQGPLPITLDPPKIGSDHATYFLKSIDGVANQGGGADKKNWQYWVNSTYADKGCGVWPLNPADVITWKFALYVPPSN